MKQIIISTVHQPIIHVFQADANSYHGYMTPTGKKGFIFWNELGNTFDYELINCISGCVGGSVLNMFEEDEFERLITHMIENMKFKVYEFETNKELLKWLVAE